MPKFPRALEAINRLGDKNRYTDEDVAKKNHTHEQATEQTDVPWHNAPSNQWSARSVDGCLFRVGSPAWAFLSLAQKGHMLCMAINTGIEFDCVAILQLYLRQTTQIIHNTRPGTLQTPSQTTRRTTPSRLRMGRFPRMQDPSNHTLPTNRNGWIALHEIQRLPRSAI